MTPTVGAPGGNARKESQLELLVQSSPGTPMGQLLRRFWQPVALSDSIETGKARALRVMGEDLTLYRGDSGRAYLVAGRCAHRGTVLHTGWIEGEKIRCMYHGWCYEGGGLCVEIPAEKRPRSEAVRIAAYPVHEYCGLVFAYLGEGAAPPFELPRKDVLEEPGRSLYTQLRIWDCNWFQHIENSLDAVHVSFAHAWGTARRFNAEITAAIPELAYVETESGIRQTATRSKSNVRVSDWTFPNNNHIVAPGPNKGDPWGDICSWVVPVDDTHTMRFLIFAAPQSASRPPAVSSGANRDFNPADYYKDLFEQHTPPDVDDVQFIGVQDYVAVRGQGVIADRLAENLSPSDAGLVFLRKIFLRELDALATGRPVKAWRKLDQPAELPLPPPRDAAAE
jgi:5,5'-dehydrodivanillate O-demethylase oxygenase subunit